MLTPCRTVLAPAYIPAPASPAAALPSLLAAVTPGPQAPRPLLSPIPAHRSAHSMHAPPLRHPIVSPIPNLPLAPLASLATLAILVTRAVLSPAPRLHQRSMRLARPVRGPRARHGRVSRGYLPTAGDGSRRHARVSCASARSTGSTRTAIRGGTTPGRRRRALPSKCRAPRHHNEWRPARHTKVGRTPRPPLPPELGPGAAVPRGANGGAGSGWPLP
jgi:hypothetical protein